jgi:hypothetical protein
VQNAGDFYDKGTSPDNYSAQWQLNYSFEDFEFKTLREAPV